MVCHSQSPVSHYVFPARGKHSLGIGKREGGGGGGGEEGICGWSESCCLFVWRIEALAGVSLVAGLLAGGGGSGAGLDMSTGNCLE